MFVLTLWLSTAGDVVAQRPPFGPSPMPSRPEPGVPAAGTPAPAEPKTRRRPAADQPQKSPSARNEPHVSGSNLIEMNFKDIEIVNFLTIMSDAIGVPFVWDEKDIKGRITLVSPKKFTPKDAYRLFETVLAMHGFTTVRREGSPVVQVVPIQDASRLPQPTLNATDEGVTGSAFVTRIVTLKYADTEQIKATIAPLITKSAAIASYPPANALIISDIESNLTRILGIVAQLDVEQGNVAYQVLQLKHASARKLAGILSQVINAMGGGIGRPGMPGQPGQTTRTSIMAEDRINALIVVGDTSALSQINKMVRELDVVSTNELSGFKVYPLAHSSSEDMEKVLNRVKTGAEKVSQPGGAPMPQPGGGPPEGLTITSDKSTNSLIVFGPPDMIKTMDAIIAKLDVRRPQVYVEALIMEMTLDKSLQLGINWQSNNVGSNGYATAGGFPNATPRTTDATMAQANRSQLGYIGNEITFQGQKFSSFSAFIEATRQDQDLNILANPQILTLDNQEAEINVSQVIPVSTKTVRGTDQVSTTEFEFKDVGIILKLTPQITGNDKVLIKLKQESSSVAAKQVAQSQTNQQAVTTLKRTINSTVLVDNDSTMAIGGLIQDKEVASETKVPCLGDIPVLGWFFRSRNESLQKTNMIVFIRPTIINNKDDLERVTRRVRVKYDKTRPVGTPMEKELRKDFKVDRPLSPKGKPSPQGTIMPTPAPDPASSTAPESPAAKPQDKPQEKTTGAATQESNSEATAPAPAAAKTATPEPPAAGASAQPTTPPASPASNATDAAADEADADTSSAPVSSRKKAAPGNTPEASPNRPLLQPAAPPANNTPPAEAP